MSSDWAIRARNLGKCYHIYDRPQDRLKQALMRGRRRYYREFWALRNVNLEVQRGETVGVIGRNGSGKSTLLQLLCSTVTPTEGSVDFNGRIGALLELAAGFNSEFTGGENVKINCAILGLTRPEIEARFDDIVAFSEIGDFINQPVKTYSSGMYVRLAFSVIAHIDADILVIDEALAVGDIFFMRKCMRFLHQFKEQGTIFLVSHDLPTVVNLCDRAMWIDEGQIRFNGSAKEAVDLYLSSLYGATQNIDGIGRRSSGPSAGDAQKAPERDPRLDTINNSRYRNEIELFEFDPQAAGFGTGGARIENLQLLDPAGGQVSMVIGGESVVLAVHCRANQRLTRPIVGFLFRDRLGQTLFGDNTYLTYASGPPTIEANQTFVARFEFRIPILSPGDYMVSAAIAEGTQEDHVQHHWAHDALVLHSSASSVSAALVGIPMHRITLALEDS